MIILNFPSFKHILNHGLFLHLNLLSIVSNFDLLTFICLTIFFYFSFTNPYLYDYNSKKLKFALLVFSACSSLLLLSVNPLFSMIIFYFVALSLIASLLVKMCHQEVFFYHNLNQFFHFFFILSLVNYSFTLLEGKSKLLTYTVVDNTPILIIALLIHQGLWFLYTFLFKSQLKTAKKYKIERNGIYFTVFNFVISVYISDHFFNENYTSTAVHILGKFNVILISLLIFYVASYLNFEHVNLQIYKKKHETLEKKNKMLSEKIEDQAKMLNELRAYRHDLKNIMHIISENNLAKESFLKTMVDSPVILDYLNQEINLSSHPYLDAYLHQFGKLCFTHDIDFTSQLIWNTTMKDNDSLRLISNLLDNAYKACLNVEQSRYIKIQSTLTYERLDVMISNSFNPDNNYSKGSGIGLSTVKRIVDANGGLFYTEKKDNEFIAYLSLFTQQEK